jgi:hypothetical protein
MNKKYLNTVVALAMLAALWAAFTYWDKHHQSTPATPSKPEEKLVAIDSSKIEAFTVKPRDGSAFTARHENGKWVLSDPSKDPSRQIPADATAVTSLLSSITGATVDQVISEQPGSLKDYGLDPPAETVELQPHGASQPIMVEFGDETPTSTGLYAQRTGSPRVVTVAGYLKTSVEKSLFDLRDKRIVTLDPDQLRRIEVASKDKHWTLEKNPEGVWDLVLPPPVRADRGLVDGLVSQIRSSTMGTILSDNKAGSAKYGFGTPALTVKFTGPAGSQTIVIGKKDGDNYDAMNSDLDPAFTVNPTFVTQFQKDAADLREKDLFSFSTFDASRIEIETPHGHWTFEKQKDKWRETAPKSKDLTADKMDGLLTDVRGLRADSFPKTTDLAELGLIHPAYKFAVRFGEKQQNEAVEAAKSAGHVYAQRATDTAASQLPDTALDSIDKALASM